MVGFPPCHQPLNTRRHPCRRWTDAPVPQPSVQNNPALVSSLATSINTLISSLLQESELTELKDTIDILKAKNTEAQEIIQGALSNPEITPKGPEYPLNLPYDYSCCPLLANSFQHSVFSLFLWCLEMLINRQNSSESISSLTSTTSHSSMGSLKEQEAKKKKKKSWVRTRIAYCRVYPGLVTLWGLTLRKGWKLTDL